MFKGSSSVLKSVIQSTYEIRQPLFISGAPGIGKSMIVKNDAIKRAEDSKLEFVDWNASTKEKKMEMFANPEKFFVFIDQRLSQFDVTDLRGLPQIQSDTEWLTTKPYAWAVFITKPGAIGTVFFDEINLASPIVAGSAYQIINDRVVADTKLSDGIYICGAGNRAEDQAHVFDMPLPLRDRFCEFELEVNTEEWIKWAIEHKVNHHLINLIQWKGSLLYNVSETSSDKATTPRGVARLSNLLGTIKNITDERTQTLSSISCGEGFAAEFMAYVRYFQDMNWDRIYNDPSSVKSFDINQTYALIGGLVEHFQKESHKGSDIVEVIANLKQDFSIYALRLMADFDKKKFAKNIVKAPNFKSHVKSQNWATILA
jgi:hypothetical protein